MSDWGKFVVEAKRRGADTSRSGVLSESPIAHLESRITAVWYQGRVVAFDHGEGRAYLAVPRGGWLEDDPDYWLDVLFGVPDGCEYNPEKKRAVYGCEAHFLSSQAEWLVGAGGKWRLCEACAKLPEFKRLRKRRRIERKPNE